MNLCQVYGRVQTVKRQCARRSLKTNCTILLVIPLLYMTCSYTSWGCQNQRFPLCAQPISHIQNVFSSFGRQNYAHFFSVFVVNNYSSYLGAEEMLQRGVFSVTRSFIPGNCYEVDKTMVETFMKHAKSRGGAGRSDAGLMKLVSNKGSLPHIEQDYS